VCAAPQAKVKGWRGIRLKLKVGVRQAKPGSTGEEVADATLKVEIGAQWVKVPPG
jgi:hypothetical protein